MDNRRQEILHAFESLVAQFGLDRVSMKDLAREAGVSVGAIYLEFPNKEALYERLGRDDTARLFELARPLAQALNDNGGYRRPAPMPDAFPE